MGIEIDFLPVGDGERSGDAIALRFGNLHGPRNEQVVMVIDGGTKESGEALVDHVQRYFGTEYVDIGLSGHPDADHSSGLYVVTQKLKMGQLWMHRPWEHCTDMAQLFKDGRITDDGLSQKLRADLQNVWDLEKLAKRKGIKIVEPFCDGEVNRILPSNILVLGPSLDFYEGLLPHFREMPDVKEASFASFFARGMRALAEVANEVISKIAESWGRETLADPDDDATSAENNSSVILLVRHEGHQLFLTGDAGVPALDRAAEFAETLGIHLPSANFSQMPHHGSKRNVGPTILDRILGPKLTTQGPSSKTAFVSAAKNGAPKHPAKKVTNAYQRRGAKVIATQGDSIHHHHDAPARQGWVRAEPVPFYREVEE